MGSVSRCARLFGSRTLALLKLNSVQPVRPRYFSLAAAVGSNRLYSDKHEWVSVDGKIGTIGISHYAQEALGEIVYAQLPDVGEEFEQFGECGAVESVKAASELYSPVSGTVTEKNEAVEETPSLINQSCYDEGWLYKLELKNADELKELMDEERYQAYLKEQTDDEE